MEQILCPDWLPEPILSAQDCSLWSQRKKFSSLKPVYIFQNFWETFSQKFRNMYFCISAVFTTFKSQTRLEESDNEEIETTRIVLNSFWNLFVWTHLWFLIHGCSKFTIPFSNTRVENLKGWPYPVRDIFFKQTFPYVPLHSLIVILFLAYLLFIAGKCWTCW